MSNVTIPKEGLMRSGTYLFVDGGHLRKHYQAATSTWFGERVPLNFVRLKHWFGADKCFYYDCLDNVRRSGEAEATYLERVAQQESDLAAIRGVFGTHVRLGALVGEGGRRQKEVDILLAVDMLNHTIRGNMATAILLSGDRDFKPVVESLVQHGLFVRVAGDKRHTSQELAQAADGYDALKFSTYFDRAPEELRNRAPLPYVTDVNPSARILSGCPDYFRHPRPFNA